MVPCSSPLGYIVQSECFLPLSGLSSNCTLNTHSPDMWYLACSDDGRVVLIDMSTWVTHVQGALNLMSLAI